MVKEASTSAVEPSPAMKETPNWLEMPHELMANIIQRLGTKEILKSARRVCTTWRRICKDPAMWKVIVMHRSFSDWDEKYNFEMLTKQAVDLSSRELIDISIGGFCTDDLLYHIVLRSSKLKRLCLLYCGHMTGSGMSRAVKMLPQLEELEFFYIHINIKDIEVIGRNCPQLKSLKIFDLKPRAYFQCDDPAVAIANYMPALRHLQIYGAEMTNDGFLAILDGCPHLESLHIHMWSILNLDVDLVKKCMKRFKDFKFNPKNSDHSYDLYSDVD